MAPVSVSVFCVLLRSASLLFRVMLPVQVLAWLAIFWSAPVPKRSVDSVRPVQIDTQADPAAALASNR